MTEIAPEKLPEGVKVGSYIRYVNWAGPCLTGIVEGIGRSRVRLDSGTYVYFIWVHTKPCERCTDHPKTQYPRGYEG